MKYLILLSILIFTTACSKEPEYINGKILYDKDGCAFIARKNLGDTIFLSFNLEISKSSCNYKEN